MGNTPFMEENLNPPHANPPRLQHAAQLERINGLLANVRSLVDTNIRFLRSDPPGNDESARSINYFRNFYDSWPMIMQQLIVVMHEMSNWDVDLARGNRIMRYSSNNRQRPGMPPVGSGASLNRSNENSSSSSGNQPTGSLFTKI